MINKFLSLPALAMALVLLFAQAARAQYVTLTASAAKRASQTLTVASNELATVVHLNTESTAEDCYLEVVSGGVTNRYCNIRINGGVATSAQAFYSANLPVIAGPATLRAVSIGAYACSSTVQITRPASTFVPVNTVVIPNDNGAPVKVALESSTDMVSWTPASPGTYGSSTTNRFFRVRAER
jgi:hypothetical protein